MKWLTPILAILLLVGCGRNDAITPPGLSGESMTVRTDRNGVIFHQERQRGVPGPWIPPQPKPVLQSQPTKDDQVQIQQRKIIGYRAKIEPRTGKITTYPVYEDEKK